MPLYEKIFLSADAIEPLATAILAHDTYGFKKLAKKQTEAPLIIRIYLTTARSYKHFRRTHPVYAGIERLYVELPMPKFVWVVELSTVELYKQKKVVGELIFDSTANKYDRLSFLYLHYPGFLLTNDRTKLADDPSRINTLEIDDKNIEPYDMYISNLRGAI